MLCLSRRRGRARRCEFHGKAGRGHSAHRPLWRWQIHRLQARRAAFGDVNSGKITLGGIDISTIDPETLLKSYSMVFQDVVLFRDTVMENIRLGRRNATDAEVLAAAETAQCDEFIRKLPQGYQTVIGENGSTLSGGERQRISIARALLKDAPHRAVG